MKIRYKLTILFTLITASLLILFAAYIFIRASTDRHEEFYINLKKEAITKANVLFDAQVDAEVLQTIYRKNRELLSEVEVAIYDTQFHLLYHDAVDIDFVKETRSMIDEINLNGEIRFNQEKWQVIGLKFHFQDKDYIITAAAYDEYGHNKLLRLRNQLIFACIISIFIIFFAGKMFAKNALNPISKMLENIEKITATNLGLRLHQGNEKDELAELAMTFNNMLDRLENSFVSQKNFVSNISHELRTPLAAIIAETELTLSLPRENHAYTRALQKILSDAKRLSKLSTDLLNLAKASYDLNEISFKNTPLDEIIIEARKEILLSNPEYTITIDIDEKIEDIQNLNVQANVYLLKVAFCNLIENACKFSPEKHCSILLSTSGPKPLISIEDHGIGIPDEDFLNLFTPFFRASNAGKIPGSGIGLSLVQKIMEHHNAQINISSKQNQGTKVIILWK